MSHGDRDTDRGRDRDMGKGLGLPFLPFSTKIKVEPAAAGNPKPKFMPKPPKPTPPGPIDLAGSGAVVPSTEVQDPHKHQTKRDADNVDYAANSRFKKFPRKTFPALPDENQSSEGKVFFSAMPVQATSTSSNFMPKLKPKQNVEQQHEESVPMKIEDDQFPDVEEWPPKWDDNCCAPLVLPLGPKTKEARVRLESENTFAALNDASGRNAEEDGDIFLLQFPHSVPNPVLQQTDVRALTLAKEKQEEKSSRRDKPDDAFTLDPTEHMSLHKYPAGRIGKLQVLKDGRMRMQIGNKLFEVEKGATTYFTQLIANMDCPTTLEAGNTGALTFLGPVTKKLVVTPFIEGTNP